MRRGQVRSPPIVRVAANPGKRCRFRFLLSLWRPTSRAGRLSGGFSPKVGGRERPAQIRAGHSQVVDRRLPSRVPSAVSNRGFNDYPDGRATPPPERDLFYRAFPIGNDC